MGAARGLLGFAGLSFLPATGVFFLVVWGGDVLLYRALGIARMPWSWSGAELAADLWGKGVRAAAGLAVSATGADHRAARSATHTARAEPTGQRPARRGHGRLRAFALEDE